MKMQFLSIFINNNYNNINKNYKRMMKLFKIDNNRNLLGEKIYFPQKTKLNSRKDALVHRVVVLPTQTVKPKIEYQNGALFSKS